MSTQYSNFLELKYEFSSTKKCIQHIWRDTYAYSKFFRSTTPVFNCTKNSILYIWMYIDAHLKSVHFSTINSDFITTIYIFWNIKGYLPYKVKYLGVILDQKLKINNPKLLMPRIYKTGRCKWVLSNI